MRKEVKDDQGYLVSISPYLLTRYNGGGDTLKALVQNQKRNVMECSDGRIRVVKEKGSLLSHKRHCVVKTQKGK